jgi:hypothetical protein
MGKSTDRIADHNPAMVENFLKLAAASAPRPAAKYAISNA